MNDVGGFTRMRRNDGVRLPGEHRILQILMFGHQAQSIGIDNERDRCGNGFLKARKGLL